MSEVGKLQLEHVPDGDWAQLRRNMEALSRQNIGRGPAQARVFNNANISITTSGTPQALTFNSERFDTGGFHSTSSNTGRLTAPTAGLYTGIAHVWFASNGTGLRRVVVRLNGTTEIGGDQKGAVTGGVTEFSVPFLHKMVAGDYLEVVVTQTSGGALNVTSNAQTSPEFSIVRLGSQA